MSERRSKKPSLQELVERVGLDVIGQRVRRLRGRQNYSIRDLAEVAQVSKNTLLRLEQGQPTHLSTITAICKALKVKPSELLSPEFGHVSVRAIHRNSDFVWLDMNNFKGSGQDKPLDSASVREGTLGPEVTPFSIIQARLGGGIFNPNIILLTQPTPRRSHRGDEFVWVLQGKLRIVFEDGPIDLDVDEGCMFWAAEMHHYEPLSKDIPTKVLSIVLDPFPNQTVRLHMGKKSETKD